MGIKDIRGKAAVFIKKYRFVALVLLIGLALMVLPSQNNEAVPIASQESKLYDEVNVAEELAEILSHVDGAGDVKVLLTVESGEEIFYQTDEEASTGPESSSTQVRTVTLTDGNKSEYGLVRQTKSPIYKGAVIVCQGADNPEVHLMIVDAVSKLTGLGANRISVVKMK